MSAATSGHYGSPVPGPEYLIPRPSQTCSVSPDLPNIGFARLPDIREARPDERVVMHLLVIGGGPAGVSAALQGAELGATVTLVERKRVGGTSINEGPAPIRTLARAARLARDAQS